jgi:tetratricopeptide (TPR) repeat protein
MPHDPAQRLPRLLSYLEADPDNETLLLDAIQTAIDERAPDTALALITRRASQADARRYRAFEALAQMQLGKHEAAVSIFADLLQDAPDDPALRFNAAYARAHAQDFDAALALLDENVGSTLPQAAALHVQLLHQIGDVDGAAHAAKTYLAIHPEHKALLAAASVLAIDLEDFDQARDLSERAGDHPDALTTLGTLALDQGRNVEALSIFDRVLGTNPDKPRAHIGRGLAKMLAGDYIAAADDIERGAEKFSTHSGSWIGAGWANLFAQRYEHARTDFEKAVASDRNFSEAHGSLAVLHLLQGRIDEGRHLAQTALRLDPQSFSGALAKSILLSSAGKADQAKAIIQKALTTPIDEHGKTIADALIRYGLTS